MNPVLVVRIQFLGDGPNREDREAVERAINEHTNPDVLAIIESKWEARERVRGSTEAPIGGGILSAIVDMSGSAFVHHVECDPDQTGEEVEFFVHMPNAAEPSVILRCAVTEVKPVAD